MKEQATILVIDSDPGIKDDFASRSSRFGYRIELVRDGSAGLEALEANLPDLIILNAELSGACRVGRPRFDASSSGHPGCL